MRREELPQSATEILNRVNEISFNSSLLREMRAIRFVTRLIDDGRVVNGSLRRMRIHCVAADDAISQLSVASKLETDWNFLHRPARHWPREGRAILVRCCRIDSGVFL
jgi:NTE family protein